jgi:hypothetical protein
MAPGANAFVGPAGNGARTGVLGVLLLLPPDEFLTRNGLVSELEDADLGIGGVGSSKGESKSTKEVMSVFGTRIMRKRGQGKEAKRYLYHLSPRVWSQWPSFDVGDNGPSILGNKLIGLPFW